MGRKDLEIKELQGQVADLQAQLKEKTAEADRTFRMLESVNNSSHLAIWIAYFNENGEPGDVLLAISTSGNSENILHAARTAKLRGVSVIGLTGESGGKLKVLSDITICAPSSVTYQIQEYHLPIYNNHLINILFSNLLPPHFHSLHG